MRFSSSVIGNKRFSSSFTGNTCFSSSFTGNTCFSSSFTWNECFSSLLTGNTCFSSSFTGTRVFLPYLQETHVILPHLQEHVFFFLTYWKHVFFFLTSRKNMFFSSRFAEFNKLNLCRFYIRVYNRYSVAQNCEQLCGIAPNCSRTARYWAALCEIARNCVEFTGLASNTLLTWLSYLTRVNTYFYVELLIIRLTLFLIRSHFYIKWTCSLTICTL